MHAIVQLHVNGDRYETGVPMHYTLLETLRYVLGLTGSKQGCDKGDCGACTVLVDGEPVLSCLTPVLEAVGREITTVEGLARAGEPHPLQAAFADCGAAQCGFCTPGVLMSAYGLLLRNPLPDRQQIREALSGNLCRCTGYTKIYEAVERAAEMLRARVEADAVGAEPPATAPAPAAAANGNAPAAQDGNELTAAARASAQGEPIPLAERTGPGGSV